MVHVAGTNGKGSTCAFIRAMAEAAGQRVHVYTSPHLVRFNERIRIAGKLVADDALTAALEHVERVNAGAAITVFEVITAVAFHLFAQTPADLCVLEVGSRRSRRRDQCDRPAGGLRDHLDLARSSRIAGRHAAAHRGGEGRHHEAGRAGGDRRAAGGGDRRAAGGGRARRCAGAAARSRLACSTRASLQRRDGILDLPPPSLPGAFQLDNAGIAIAAMRASRAADECRPASPRRNGRRDCSACTGRLASLLPADWELWLDGGHNPGAGIVLAEHLRAGSDRPVHLVVGMKQTKDAAEFLRPLVPSATHPLGGGGAGSA